MADPESAYAKLPTFLL